MGIKIVPTLSEEEKREKAERESLISRLKGLSSEELKSMLKVTDERALSDMDVDTPSETMASGGAVNKNYAYGGRVAKMSSEKS